MKIASAPLGQATRQESWQAQSSANVNDLHGFCVDRLAPLFAWTGPPPCSYGFSASWFAMPFRGTLHHPYICPCFWRKHFYAPLFLDFLWNANCTWAMAGLLERLPNNSGNKGMCLDCMAGCVAHCGMWLGGQPRVGAKCINSVWLAYHIAELAVL